MRVQLSVVLLLFVFFSCNIKGEKSTGGSYVIEVEMEVFDSPKAKEGTPRIDRDTVSAGSTVEAYSKGIQKYAAVLLDIHRNEQETKTQSGSLRVVDSEGKDIVAGIEQTKRDSVLMNFIQFARRTNIPYYEHVKDFELKVMSVR